ncbi:MAG: ABC transporter permease [Chloroflexi bacterium]|nr:ABC transporter permease [Chloroflexota bacterium]
MVRSVARLLRLESSDVRRNAVSAASVIVLLVIWQIIADLRLFEQTLFPEPRGIVQSYHYWWANGGLATGLSISLRRMVMAYALSLAIGIPIGMLIGRFPLADWTLGTVVRLLQPIPGIAWVPLAVVWFTSVSESAKIFIVITGGVFPVLVSTSAGVRTVPPAYLRVARTLGVRGLGLFTWVVFPATIPSIVAGMRISWAFCWRSLMAAEIVLAARTGPGQEGLGGLIAVARQLDQINTAGMVMVTLAAVGLLIDGLVFHAVERRIRRRRGLTE